MTRAKILEMVKTIADTFEKYRPENAPYSCTVNDYILTHNKEVCVYGQDGTLVYSQTVCGDWRDMAVVLLNFQPADLKEKLDASEVEEPVEEDNPVQTIIATVPRKQPKKKPRRRNGGSSNEKN